MISVLFELAPLMLGQLSIREQETRVPPFRYLVARMHEFPHLLDIVSPHRPFSLELRDQDHMVARGFEDNLAFVFCCNALEGIFDRHD